MKSVNTAVLSFLFLICAAHAFSQTAAPATNHFAKNGLSFDYPADVSLDEKNVSEGQHLILVQGQNGAQIMVFSRYQKVDTADRLAQARRDVFDAFIESMLQEFARQQTKVERTETKISVAGVEAPGVRLRAVLDNTPGNAEAYSLPLGGRLVVVTLIGGDKELEAAAVAWAVVRNSLRVE